MCVWRSYSIPSNFIVWHLRWRIHTRWINESRPSHRIIQYVWIMFPHTHTHTHVHTDTHTHMYTQTPSCCRVNSLQGAQWQLGLYVGDYWRPQLPRDRAAVGWSTHFSSGSCDRWTLDRNDSGCVGRMVDSTIKYVQLNSSMITRCSPIYKARVAIIICQAW